MPSAQELDGDKKAYVSALNPVSALEVIKNEELRNIAEEVSEKLKRVLDKVAKGKKDLPMNRRMKRRKL